MKTKMKNDLQEEAAINDCQTLTSNGNIVSGFDQPSTIPSDNVNQTTLDVSGQVALSADGYIRYNGDAAAVENSYQGLYSSATLASSNNAYESIPE